MTLLSCQPLRQPAPIMGAHLLRLQGEEAQLRIQPPLGPPLLRQNHLLKQREKGRGRRSERSPNAPSPVKPYHQLRRNQKYSPSLLTLKLKVPSGTQIVPSVHPRAHLTRFNNKFYTPPCYILIKHDSNFSLCSPPSTFGFICFVHILGIKQF